MKCELEEFPSQGAMGGVELLYTQDLPFLKSIENIYPPYTRTAFTDHHASRIDHRPTIVVST
jgi:hypothetical protein